MKPVEFKNIKTTLINNILIQDTGIYNFDVNDVIDIMQNMDIDSSIINITTLATNETMYMDVEDSYEKIKDIVDENKEIVVLLTVDMEEIISDESVCMGEKHMLLDDIDDYLLGENFINVNKTIGQYQTKEVYIFDNKVGRQIIDTI